MGDGGKMVDEAGRAKNGVHICYSQAISPESLFPRSWRTEPASRCIFSMEHTHKIPGDILVFSAAKQVLTLFASNIQFLAE